ncbi:MAG: bacillithiol biosynthesis deacetylase BshB1 [Bacteroidetes bacterium]|jgi:bacillithiol biosynthesis deacetylase BshB1|nr:MAG: bacillithiol biosynthesis deacetylase BshB1 [Bacteroidota bacterium]
MKLDILAFGAHPDDVEISCVGTILKHIDLGYTVGIIDLTGGELGTRGNKDIRLKEAEAARQMIGAHIRENLNMRDGFFKNDEDHQLAIITKIRQYQPDIILANAPSDRHPDHGRAAHLIEECAFLSGLYKIETFINGEKQMAWRPKAVYHYIQDYYLEPHFVVDISEYFHRKMNILKCYASQFYNPNSTEPETPISGKSFFDVIEGKARMWGRYISVEFAEGFIVNRPMGVEDITKLK